MLVALVTYVVTFLMASVLNIAAGQPFSAVQILWINFAITAPMGIALGLDKETPGLMKRVPRPRSASIMSPAVITTVGLVGLFMAVAINSVIVFGKDQFGHAEIGSTMGLVAFSLMLVIAAFECRDEKATILDRETFDNRTLNITALVEIALAVLITEGVPAVVPAHRQVDGRSVDDRGRAGGAVVCAVGGREGAGAAPG